MLISYGTESVYICFPLGNSVDYRRVMVDFVDALGQQKTSLWLLQKCKLEDFQFLKLDSIDQLCHFCSTNVQFYGNKSTVYLCELLHLVIHSSTFDNISSFIIKILCPFHSPSIIRYPSSRLIYSLCHALAILCKTIV